MLDYERHARQIALTELGADGQRRLSETPVDLSAAPAIASELHRRAGGVTSPEGSIRVALEDASTSPAWELGASAWAAVEAARRLLGAASCEMPAALSERLKSG